jgi:hypothetical protein
MLTAPVTGFIFIREICVIFKTKYPPDALIER